MAKTRAPMEGEGIRVRAEVVKRGWERPVKRQLGGPVSRQKAVASLGHLHCTSLPFSVFTAEWSFLSLEQLFIAIATTNGLVVPLPAVMLDK